MSPSERFRERERLSASKLTRLSSGIEGASRIRGDGLIVVTRSGDLLTVGLDVDALIIRINVG